MAGHDDGRNGPPRKRSRVRRAAVLLVNAAAVLAALCLALMAAVWWGQERLIFRPTPLPADHRWPLAPDVHEVQVNVAGARLNALHLRLPRPDGLVFYLHGNAGNLQNWFINLDFYRALNIDLFMLDYRGYGKSSGQIDGPAQLLGDLRTAWDQVTPAYAGRPVVLYGRSLGSGLAAQLAASLPVAQRPELLLLVSPYRSLQALTAEHYPWVPAALLRYPLRSDLALQALAGGKRPQLLLLHGERDTLIPPTHSDALAALVPGAQLRHIAEAGHNDLQRFPVFLDAVRSGIRGAVTAGR